MAWSLSARSPFLGKGTPRPSYSRTEERTDIPGGRSPRQLRKEPFSTEIDRLVCASTSVTTPPLAPHQSWVHAILTQHSLGDMV